MFEQTAVHQGTPIAHAPLYYATEAARLLSPPRLIKPCCQEKRLRESLLTFSVRLFITSFFDNVTFHRQDIPVSHVRHPSVPWVFTCQRQECSPMFLYLPPNFNINRITGIRQKWPVCIKIQVHGILFVCIQLNYFCCLWFLVKNNLTHSW